MLLYSLIFGLAAWALALWAIWKPKHLTVLVTGSFGCAFISAAWQFFEIQKRALTGDFGGIADTIGAVIIGVIFMMAVTLLLNFLALKRSQK